MWRAAAFFFSLFLLGPLGLAEAQLFSEGGGNAWAAGKQTLEQPEQLSGIVDELRALRNLQQQEQREPEPYYGAQAGGRLDSYEQASQYLENEAAESDPLELAKISADIQKLLKQQQQDEELGDQAEQQPVAPVKGPAKTVDQQKRGQSEFVEFVEPHAAKALKSVEFMDKRAPVASIDGQSGAHYLYYSTNNVLFIVAITVCSVVAVAGVVGGAYHINNIRKQRNEAFDDFTRYSPAGPGRNVLRRGREFAGSPIADLGDDALAKAAHLHHFEQTKQKIIGSDNGLNNDDQSDKSDDEDLEGEQNFSIYECPGLALSGDLEVKNPNFEQQHP